MKDHPGAGVTHDRPYLFSHLRLVTVDLAIGTEGLILHERTLVTSLPSVICQSLASFTKLIFPGVMMIMTIDHDHFLYDLFFFFSFLSDILH